MTTGHVKGRLFPTASVAAMVTVTAVVVVLLANSFNEIQGPIAWAITCRDEARAAVATLEAGATEYQGECVQVALGNSGPGVLAGSEEEAEQAVSEVAAVVLPDHLTSTLVRTVGGYTGTFLAFTMGLLGYGGMVESGLTAMLVANGVTRRRWLVATLLKSAVLTAIGYATCLVLVGASIAWWSRSQAIPATWPELDTLGRLASALPGMSVYFLLGVLTAALTRRAGPLIALYLPILFVDGLIASEGAWVSPALMHATLLQNNPPGPYAFLVWRFPPEFPTVAVAIGILAAMALLLLGVCAGIAGNRAIPDRPR